ncbi:MAG: hypothetical protein Fues2KO_01520 [Fuerstiella sp.]
MAWTPGFIGIGAEKSATTWAWTMLNAHPEVCMSQPKELNYFNIDENYQRGSAWYRRHFATPSQVAGEISPLYMDDARVADRILESFPETRLLVMLRDPFDRAMSHLFHDASVVYGRVADLTCDELRTLASKDDKYIRRSSYATALTPFFERFPHDRIAVHFFDDVQEHALQTAQDLYRFVGVDAGFVPEQFDQKVNRSQDLRSVAGLIMGASRTARSFPPARVAMNWIYRRTQMRERVIRWLMVDKGRAQISFDDVFSPADRQQLEAQLSQLSDMLPGCLPESWVESVTVLRAA